MSSRYFFYEGVNLPGEKSFLLQLHNAAAELYDQLIKMDPRVLPVSEYNQRYLSDYLSHLRGILQLKTYLIAYSVLHQKITLEEFVFVDYGGGTGVLALLAKKLGIGTVIYNDIYDISCRDAEALGRSLGLMADHYAPGDIDDLIHFMKEKNIACNGVASSEVIEHIYDVPLWLSKLKFMAADSFNLVMNSSANQYNPRIRKNRKQLQINDELYDREKPPGHKERDTLRSFLSIRKEMIKEKFGDQLSATEINELARGTRGKMEKDIYDSVELYLRTNVMPAKPTHSTNTCDPYTGNWTEHLMNPYQLKDNLFGHGFDASVKAGYYQSSPNILNTTKRLLNVLLSVFGNAALFIAPSYTLFARKQK